MSDFTELPLPGTERFTLHLSMRDLALAIFKLDEGGPKTSATMFDLLVALPFERLLSRYVDVHEQRVDRDVYLLDDAPTSLYGYAAVGRDEPIFDVVHGATDDDCREWAGLDADALLGPSDPNDPANWYDVSVDRVDGGTLHDYLGPYASAGDKLRHAEGLARAQGWLVPFEPATAEQRAQIAVARAAMKTELWFARVFAATSMPASPFLPGARVPTAAVSVEASPDPFGELCIRIADEHGRRRSSTYLLDRVIAALPRITDERSRGRIMRALGIDGILPDPWNGSKPVEADPFDDVLACLEERPERFTVRRRIDADVWACPCGAEHFEPRVGLRCLCGVAFTPIATA